MHAHTQLALTGRNLDKQFLSVCAPIYQTAIFQAGDGDNPYDYSRSGNPTRTALEQQLARLDGGCGALAFNSGMAAISTVLGSFAAGSHVICSHDCYGGTARLLTLLAQQNKVDVSFIDTRDEAAVEAAIRPTTRAIWLETPSNPLLRISDIRSLALLAHSFNIKLVVDNTFLSPLLQRPLNLGADIVLYSTTKYINGHSDVIGGALVCRDERDLEELSLLTNAHGTGAAPFDSWLVIRGLKTLPIRMRQHEENARALAEFLDGHPAVQRVNYPGLATHPEHQLACEQQSGFGAVLSIELRSEAAARRLLRSVRIFSVAVSIGGVESLIEHPATMSHASMTTEQQESAGLGDNLIRLSVGIENINDLIADLEQGLEQRDGRLTELLDGVSAWEL